MRKIHAYLLLAAGSVALSACGGGGIFNRDRPDEMAVQRQAPLVVPPDFEMAPPQPGAPRPVEGSASQEALDALFGGPAPRSNLETSALDQAGSAAPGIRSTVGDENTNAVAKGTVTRDILAAPQNDGDVARAVIPG
ncbi:MAG: DUF3035 domain-containing protein [Novosphingobium sp.]|nr:DUF3035 domain-containing protein [Novosphingobium sp.]